MASQGVVYLPDHPGDPLHHRYGGPVPQSTGMTGPRRRASDHVHEEYWTMLEQHRYEDGIKEELRAINREVKSLSNRLLLLMGGIILLAFLLPIAAPFIRGLVGIP